VIVISVEVGKFVTEAKVIVSPVPIPMEEDKVVEKRDKYRLR